MKTTNLLYWFVKILLSLVWLLNGLFCKLLNFVPRHQLIVARILGAEHSHLLINTIGFLEIMMALWIISGLKSILCACVQITLIVSMNIIEYIFAKDLLLFGGYNLVLAMLLVAVIYYSEFKLKPQFKRH